MVYVGRAVLPPVSQLPTTLIQKRILRYTKIVYFSHFCFDLDAVFDVLFNRKYCRPTLFCHREKNYIVVLLPKSYRQVISSSFNVELWWNSSVNEF